MRHLSPFLGALLWSAGAQAHGFAGSGLVFPLTGIGNMLAVMAVGAWSAQIGGRAVWVVPSVFAVAMLLVGVVGLSDVPFHWADTLTALSVLLLGSLLLIDRPIAWPIAIGAVLAVGVVHGNEIPFADNATNDVLRFVVSTAGLLVVGLVGALLFLEMSKGRLVLRGLGCVVVLSGLGLVIPLV